MRTKKHPWLKTFFKSQKKIDLINLKNEKNELSLLQLNIQEAENKCNKEKKRLLAEIDSIYKWMNEAISSVYYVPSLYIYKEFENYEAIKQHELNQKISENLVYRCDNIVAGYVAQIQLRTKKMEMCNNLLEKYYQTQISLKLFIEKQKNNIQEQKKSENLDKHIERLSLLQKNDLENILSEAENNENTDLALEFFREELTIHNELLKKIDQLIEDKKSGKNQ